MKKIIFIFLVFIFFSIINVNAKVNDNQVNIYFFHSNTCSHCKEESKFLKELETRYKNINVYKYEIHDENNYEILKEVEKIYHPFYNRHTLGTNLKDFDDPVQSEFSKSCRQNIRKKLAMGMEYKVTVNPTDFETFKKCYYSTMERNEATDYYYFDDEYFKKIHEYYGPYTILVETIFEGKTIAAGLYYICNKIIHIHLSGTLKEYLNLSPAYILRYGVTMWGKENGYELIHHGGGRSSSEEDSLYLFKKQFAKNTSFDFYLGKKIWNKEIYDKLCEIANVSKDEEFFPAYRKTLH